MTPVRIAQHTHLTRLCGLRAHPSDRLIGQTAIAPRTARRLLAITPALYLDALAVDAATPRATLKRLHTRLLASIEAPDAPGVGDPSWTLDDVQDALFRQGRASGRTAGVVAAALGVDKSTYHRWLKGIGGRS